MSKRDRRRKNTLIRLIISDPYRKLVAIGLALALWFYLDYQVSGDYVLRLEPQAFDRDRYFTGDLAQNTLGVPIPLATVSTRGFSNADTDKLIEEVVLNFRGPKSILQKFEQGVAERLFRLMENVLRMAVTTTCHGYDPNVVRKRMPSVVELVDVIRTENSKSE